MNAHIIGVNREPDKHSYIGLGLYRLIVNFDVQLTILDASSESRVISIETYSKLFNALKQQISMCTAFNYIRRDCRI